jgi:hypothetical protein
VVEVEEKPSEGLFGMTNTTAVVSILGFVMVVLLAVLLLRGRESDSEIIETKSMTDYGMGLSSCSNSGTNSCSTSRNGQQRTTNSCSGITSGLDHGTMVILW